MKRLLWISLFGLTGAGVGNSCTPLVPIDCEALHKCSSPGDGDGEGSGGAGDGDGDTSTGGGDGGTSSGGSSGDGDGDTGTGGMIDPCDACDGETPVCVDEECVACTAEEHGSCSEDEVCSTENECVSCTESIHCKEPGSSVCDLDTNECASCVINDDCTHIDDKHVCDSGACVGCVDETDCGGKVCDPSTHTCTEFTAGTEFACESCEYDAQCASGHVCVEMSYSDPEDGIVGKFCLWRRDAALPGPNGSCGLNSRPYAQQATVETADGDEAVVCRPRTTTCVALLQHSTTVAGCAVEFTDDAACGAPNFNDGRCRNNSSSEPRCSYPCAGNEDCNPGFTCPAAGDRYCSL